MGYIYKITNRLNGKSYIGKTEFSIQRRFQQHCKDAKKPQEQIRPLYRAMNKYGIENFFVEQLDQASDPNELANKEIYWIGRFNTYENGYNATLGGDGRSYLNHAAIADSLRQNANGKAIAQQYGCSRDTVYAIAKAYGIKLHHGGQENVNAPKTVEQWSKDGKQYLRSFNTVTEAAQWCYENGYAVSHTSGTRGHISSCANGKVKTAYQFVWKYPN